MRERSNKGVQGEERADQRVESRLRFWSFWRNCSQNPSMNLMPSMPSAGHNFAHCINGLPATVWNFGSPAASPSRQKTSWVQASDRSARELLANCSPLQSANNQTSATGGPARPDAGSSTHSLVSQSHVLIQVLRRTLRRIQPSSIRSGRDNCSVSTRHPVPHP